VSLQIWDNYRFILKEKNTLCAAYRVEKHDKTILLLIFPKLPNHQLPRHLVGAY
jgi:hypothetical protein